MIRDSKELVDDAVKQLRRYQTNQDTPIRTRYDHFNENNLGGMFKQTCIVIGGISGSGKSYFAQTLEEDMFNKELNPDCDDYLLLRCNWEMSVFKIMLRKLKLELGTTMRKILFQEPNKEDIARFKQICDSERSQQIKYLQEATEPSDWGIQVREFLEQNKEKKHILVTIDHAALIKDGGNKTKAIGDLIEEANKLKLEFTNVTFLFLTQLNRNIETRTDIRFLAPIRSDIYNADTIFHIADVVMIIHNPYRANHDKYMVVQGLGSKTAQNGKTIRYQHLLEHMVDAEKATTNFNTTNRLFYHYLKMRDVDGDFASVKDLHIGLFYMTEEEEEKQSQKTTNPFANYTDEFTPEN